MHMQSISTPTCAPTPPPASCSPRPRELSPSAPLSPTPVYPYYPRAPPVAFPLPPNSKYRQWLSHLRRYPSPPSPDPSFSSSSSSSFTSLLQQLLLLVDMSATNTELNVKRKLRAGDGPPSTSASTSRTRAAVAQFDVDARLISAFERSAESGTPFNYSTEVVDAFDAEPEPEKIPAYLNKIQRGGFVQSFGCLLCLDPTSFSVLAHSENVQDLLGDVRLGDDARTLFLPASAASLAKALNCADLSLLNPIWVCSVATKKHFYAIMHRVDVGVLVDFEPAVAPGGDPGPSIVGAVQSQKLAARVVSRLQALPGGDIGALCDAVVENVRELTGYDRVMVYKFHEDEHGEVVAEVKRSDLEGYLGLHYPATDIPQAARFLFKQNKIRMICDCDAKPVRVVQDIVKVKSPLCLVNSTVRAPHPCHAEYMVNMGSIASLTMAIIVNEKESTRLWGLLVCHHTSVRYVPFPLRYACEFLIQAFSLQLSMELQLNAQKAEKKILQTQTMLCDMIIRDNAVTSVVTGSPSIMDLIKCDGAALYYRGRFHLLGVTPYESQLMDIIRWLTATQHDSTGLSTDSLSESGYAGAASLGDKVCGMACAKITDRDFMFWFRSHTSKEVKWGGAKHDPEIRDDDGRMHPRLSFHAFLEVMKSRSVPWEITELNAIQSLRLVMRGTIEGNKTNKRDAEDDGPHAVEMHKLEELRCVAYEMVRLIETATVPIVAVNCAGLINGWNAKAAELTGLYANEAMEKSLVHELIHEDSREDAAYHLSRALQGLEDKDIELKLRTFGLRTKEHAVFIMANACCSRDYTQSIIGVCFVGQDVTMVKSVMDKFIRLQGDYRAVVQSLSPLIPPIFICDENSCCSEWNAAMESLTGWMRYEMLGKILPGEVFGKYCRLKDEDALTKFKIVLYDASIGQDRDKEYFSFYNKDGKFVEALLTVNRRTSRDGKIQGSVCFLRTTPDLQQVFESHRQNENKLLAQLRGLAYIKQELSNPVRGVRFSHQLLEATGLSDEQRKLLETSSACEKQLSKIIEDTELECIEKGTVELDTRGFTLGTVINTVISQVMPLVKERKLQLLCQIPEDLKAVSIYGDQSRLQQVLANFLVSIVHYAPRSDGCVDFQVMPSACKTDFIPDAAHLKFRISHTGCSLPSELIQDMFDRNECATHEGLTLNISRRLLKLMGGDVQYVREAEKCYFVVNVGMQPDLGSMMKDQDRSNQGSYSSSC